MGFFIIWDFQLHVTWFFSRFSPSRWYCKTVVFCLGSTVKLYFLSQKPLAKNPGQKSGQKSGHADHVLKTQLYVVACFFLGRVVLYTVKTLVKTLAKNLVKNLAKKSSDKLTENLPEAPRKKKNGNCK